MSNQCHKVHRALANFSLIELLVNALVISRLDSRTSFGLLKQGLDKLRRIQNTAARLITGTKLRES